MTVFVTGGAGYIGSHTCVELLEQGMEVVVADNLVNSSAKALKRVEQITGKTLTYYQADIRDQAALDRIFEAHSVDCVMHFAGLKAVGESVEKPLEYYTNNLTSTLTLCKSMAAHGVKKIIFSSSATVYSGDNEVPLREDSRIGNCTNPYGWTKYMSEQILRDIAKADPEWSVVLLRYFNPIGAHPSGLIGEDPRGIPNNLMPFIAQVAVGRRDHLNVFGNDYDTHDGTGVRDYIHVEDLIDAHLLALDYLKQGNPSAAFNLGNGQGFSNREIIEAARKVTGHPIPVTEAPRRPGDPATLIASSRKAMEVLRWQPKHTGVEEIIASAWKWHAAHPNGYGED